MTVHLKTFWRRIEDVLTRTVSLDDTSWRHLEYIFAVRFEDILKTSWRRYGKTSWRSLKDILKTSWKVLKTYDQDKYIRLNQDVLSEYVRLDQDVLKTSSEDVLPRRIFSSRSRDLERLEGVFWIQRQKTSSRRLHQEECLLGSTRFIKNLKKSFCFSLIYFSHLYNELYHHLLLPPFSFLEKLIFLGSTLVEACQIGVFFKISCFDVRHMFAIDFRSLIMSFLSLFFYIVICLCFQGKCFYTWHQHLF